jgi:type IV pilus assembly protein PilA
MPRDLAPSGGEDGQPGCLEDPIPVWSREGPERQDHGLANPLPSPKGITHVLATLKKRYEREDEGFTLIELMVVVLIIAILLAIAIPTFLGARERANDRAAQSSLRNALTAAKTIYTDSQDYSKASPASVFAVEPSLTYLVGTSDNYKEVAVDHTLTDRWAGAAWSKSGKCFFIRDIATGGTTFGSTTTSSNCTGAQALANATASEF